MSFTKERDALVDPMQHLAPIVAESSNGAYTVRVSTNRFQVIGRQTSLGILLGAPSRDGDYDELSLSEGAYDMTNLRPKDTGVPMAIWISQKDGARHGPRVKVTREPRAAHADISVSIHDPIEIKAPRRVNHADKIAKDEWELLKKWIELNRDVLLRHWDGDLAYVDDAKELMQKV